MKIAVVHEWLIDWAGSERVLEQILACYPNADLFALVDLLDADHRMKILNKQATTSFLQRMPLVGTRLKYYLPWMPMAIEQFNLSAYDLIISSSHAVAKGVITGPEQLHISYIHSPMRYAWDLQHEYLRGRDGRGIRGILLRWILHYLRRWDLGTANGVDVFIANSKFVAKRIRKIYRRDANVIYPPVDIDAFRVCDSKQGFYLCAGRLESYKRIDLAIQAFAKMPSRKLVILGDGPDFQNLKRIAPSNVEFIGYQPKEAWARYLQEAKALIFPGIEDFGITPVEAQACGTPVIAYNRGGATETVIPLDLPKATGILFDEQNAASIVAAVESFEVNSHRFEASNCRKNAERFSNAQFRQELCAFVEQSISKSALSHADTLSSPIERPI